MKYCTHCGAELLDEAVMCPKCGCSCGKVKSDSNGLQTAAKVLMIIATVILGIYIIPLAWCLPMTIHYCNAIKNKEKVGTGFKVCSLLFVSLLAGIFMLCDGND